MTNKIKTIFFDFGGVLSKDYFYSSLVETRPEITDYTTTLFIDDSAKNIELFESKGGVGYLYKEFEEFERWTKNNL
jgi:hypothetical protein